MRRIFYTVLKYFCNIEETIPNIKVDIIYKNTN